MPRGGNNRLPAAVKRQRGTLRKHREKSGAPELQIGEVGPPPARMSKLERAAWLELAPQVARVYTPSDRAMFSLLVRQWAVLDDPRTITDMPATAYARIVQVVSGMLQQFGCSPASRGRVAAAPDGDEAGKPADPTDEFANPGAVRAH